MKKVLCALVVLGAAACSTNDLAGYEKFLEAKYGMKHTCDEWRVVGRLDVLACKGSDNIVRNVFLINGELTY